MKRVICIRCLLTRELRIRLPDGHHKLKCTRCKAWTNHKVGDKAVDFTPPVMHRHD